MKKLVFVFGLVLCLACNNYGNLSFLANLPNTLEEVSGAEVINGSELLWMHNDSGNKPYVYGVDEKGNIQREVEVKAKNHDWEDLTADDEGNLYIGDFGNNDNDRKNLVILKIKKEDLFNKDKVDVKKIKFSYPDQYKFPPKKGQLFFDAESIFYAYGNLYVFTKSSVKNEYGKTKLYRIPAKKGKYEAEFVAEFNAGEAYDNKITSASISPDKSKVVLLTHNKIFLFTNFTSDNFFSGKCTRINLKHTSQKEAITFKNNNTVYITDEENGKTGRNLYTYTF